MSVSLYGSGQTVIQAVSVTSALNASTSSTTYVTTGLSASITPQSTNSKILIMVSGVGGMNNYQGTIFYTIFRGTVSGTNLSTSTNASFGQNYVVVNGPQYTNLGINYLDSPATTSSTTYTVGFLNSSAAGTGYFGNNNACTITLLEVAYA